MKIPDQSSLTGCIVVEQVKYIEKAPLEIVNEVLGILDACIYWGA